MQLRWNFFQESEFGEGGNNTSKFTQIYCWTPSRRFSCSRQLVSDEPSMCSSIFCCLGHSGRSSSSSSHLSSMLKVPNVKCPLQVDTHCLKCLITSRGTNLELKITNLDLETKNMIYTISPPDHNKILT